MNKTCCNSKKSITAKSKQDVGLALTFSFKMSSLYCLLSNKRIDSYYRDEGEKAES